MSNSPPKLFGSGRNDSFELGDVLAAGLSGPRPAKSTSTSSSSKVPSQAGFQFGEGLMPLPKTIPPIIPLIQTNLGEEVEWVENKAVEEKVVEEEVVEEEVVEEEAVEGEAPAVEEGKGSDDPQPQKGRAKKVFEIIAKLTLDILEKTKECDRLQEDLASLDKAHSKLKEKYLATIRSSTQTMSQSELDIAKTTMEALKLELAKAKIELETAEKNYSYLEKQAKEVEALHEITKVKFKISENDHQTTRDELSNVREELKNEQKVLREASARVKELEKEVVDLNVKYIDIDTEKERLEGVVNARNEEIKDRNKDNKGILALLTTAQDDIVRFQGQIEEFKQQMTEFQICRQSLEDEKAITASMRVQLEKMKSEPENRFPIEPKAFQPKIVDGQKPPVLNKIKNLADELGSDLGSSQGTGARSTEAGSQHDSQSNQSNDSGSEDGSNPDDDASETEIETPAPEPRIEVVYIRDRYETSSHNAFICWFTTDFEFVILLYIYAVMAWAFIAPKLRQIFGSGPSFHTQTAAPANPAGLGHGAPSMMMNSAVSGDSPAPANPAAVPLPDTPDFDIAAALGPIPPAGKREKIDSPPGSVVGGGSGAGGSGGPSPDGPPGGPPRSPPGSPPGSNPGSPPGSPPVSNPGSDDGSKTSPLPSPLVDSSTEARRKAHWKQTFINFVYHLIVYYCLYISMMTILERRIWLKANEATRSLLRELLTSRSNCNNQGHSWASYFLSPRWLAFVNMSMLNVAELFRFQIKSYHLPG